MLEYYLKEENPPAIYDLSVGSKAQSLILNIHQDSFAEMAEILQGPDIPQISFLERELNLPSFLRPNPKWLYWGFGPVFESTKILQDDFLSIECPLPRVVKRPPGYELAVARGLRKQFWDERMADYEVWSEEVNWNFARSISASLSLVFKCLNYLDLPANSSRKQLLAINMYTHLGNNSISTTLGRSLLPWLDRQLEDSKHPTAAAVMKKAHEYMMGVPEFPRDDDFRAWFRGNRKLNLICPGDRSGLNPMDYDLTDSGYELYPHNVDTVAQQLTLLMGLAALSDEARKA